MEIKYVIDINKFEEYFKTCDQINIWKLTLDELNITLQNKHYNHTYRFLGHYGMEMILKFSPTEYETLYIHFLGKYIQMALFRRNNLNEKYDLPFSKRVIYYDLPFFETWPIQTIDLIQRLSRPKKQCFKPFLFIKDYVSLRNIVNTHPNKITLI